MISKLFLLTNWYIFQTFFVNNFLTNNDHGLKSLDDTKLLIVQII